MPFQKTAVAALIVTANIAYVQAAPDAGSILKNIEQQQKIPGTSPSSVKPPESTSVRPAESLTVRVKGFRFKGVKLMSEAILQEKLASFIGQSLTLTELEKATQIVTDVYRESGYMTRVYLSPQKIEDGLIEITVIEGKFSSVRVNENGVKTRIAPEVAQQYVLAHQQTGEPLRSDELERSLLLLNDLPGVKATATLDAGKNVGDSDVILRLANGPAIDGNIIANNSGAHSTGVEQVVGILNINSPSGRGDQISVIALGSEGVSYGRVSYALPVGSNGLKIGVNTAYLDYKLVDDFSPPNSNGRSQTVGLTASYPILRSRTNNLTLLGSLDRKTYINNSNGSNLNDNRTDSGSAGLSGGRYDSFGGGGYTAYGALLSFGRLILNNVVDKNNDALGPQAAGHYNKLTLNLARQQSLTEKLSLTTALNAQVASKNLNSSEKMYLGGPAGVRAYPTNEAGGDDGWLLNVDLGYRIRESWQLLAFADTGDVKQHHDTWAAATGPNRVRLSGAGFGAEWAQNGWSARMNVAWRIGNNPLHHPITDADTDGTRHSPRVWLQVSKVF